MLACMPGQLRRREVLALGLSAGVGLLLGGCSGRRSAAPAADPMRPAVARSAPQVSAPQGLWYTVDRGDTLSSISRRSGLSIAEIGSANRLSSHTLMPGQRIWLPEVERLVTDPLATELHAMREELDISIRGHYRLRSRSSWTRAAVGTNNRPMGRVDRITLHHTGEHAGLVGLAGIEVVRRIERYHREGRRWAAIGYHWLVDRDGTIFEGRPAALQGAHVSGANSNNLGITCIGDFDDGLPPQRQLAAMASFLENRRRHYGVAKARVFGHRDLGPTICPGRALQRWLNAWKRA